ncbi:MAG: hypothetical protein EZS28_005164 [Streblomastix strix]|uniref:F-box/LRR-repeat protein 15-like leucin rich repeat domain-containing protein n=1 Tax=Streblomastix strix TaxID=222440 RepID=A0A5J4WWM0_9EUKA|nr:MAG: hypothetical protein EZS28_005164 [Streblomastix strix]
MQPVNLEDLSPQIIGGIVNELGPSSIFTLGRVSKRLNTSVRAAASVAPRVSVSEPEGQYYFQKLVASLPNIKEINMSHSLFLTNELIGYLVDHCPKLEVVNAWNCLTLTDQALHHISHLENLRWLNVGDNPNFTADGLSEIVEKCNKLTYLDFTLCPEVSSNTPSKQDGHDIDNLLAHTIATKGLELQELVCEFCAGFGNDSTLYELLNGSCKKIQRIVMGNCAVTDTGIGYLVDSPFANNLQQVDLRRNPQLSQVGYDKLYSEIRSLVEIDGILVTTLPPRDVGQFFFNRRQLYGEGG